jgi:hypothetical protein
MMSIAKLFTTHPGSVGETYSQHLGTAYSFGARMVLAGGACILHGIFPEWADLGAHI